jgi:hypothetical protein
MIFVGQWKIDDIKGAVSGSAVGRALLVESFKYRD